MSASDTTTGLRIAAAQLSAYCWLLYAIGPITLILREDFGVSRPAAAAHSTSMAMGFILAGAVTERLLSQKSEASLQSLALGGLAIGTVALALGPTLLVTIAACLVCGFSGALLVNILNHGIQARHGARTPASLAFLNAMGATIGVTAPAAIGFAEGVGLSWRWLLAALALTVGGMSFSARHHHKAAPSAGQIPWASEPEVFAETSAHGAALARPQDRQSTHVPPTYLSAESAAPHRRFTAAVIALLCGMTIEFTTSLFAADVIRSQTHVSISSATSWAATFMAGFAVGRWSVAIATRHLPAARLAVVAFILCTCGALLLAQASTPGGCAVALCVLGLGTGPAYPLVTALALSTVPGREPYAIARIGVLSGIVIAIAPFVLGALADNRHLGIKFLLLSLSGTALTAVGCLWFAFTYASHGLTEIGHPPTG